MGRKLSFSQTGIFNGTREDRKMGLRVNLETGSKELTKVCNDIRLGGNV